jgi:hypothetical protein
MIENRSFTDNNKLPGKIKFTLKITCPLWCELLDPLHMICAQIAGEVVWSEVEQESDIGEVIQADDRII